MIPLKLNIKNFVSYGSTQEVIDFSPHNLICLSGKNGHGKSALLDAITWAIWGQARKPSGVVKAEEGLLRLGQSHMMVSLEFSSNNLTYKIKREYVLTGSKGQTNLEFGIIDYNNTNSKILIKPLTEKTIRATQKKIESTIGLDYDSFVNSAFIRQGLSNEFSKKSPKERKDILCSVLGLNKYEDIKTKANEKAKILNQEKKYLENYQNTIKEELKQKSDILDKVEILNDDLNKIQIQENEIKDTLENLKQKQKELIIQKEQYEKYKYQEQQLNKQLKEYKQSFVKEVKIFRSTLKSNRDLGNYKELESKKIEVDNKIEHLQRMAQTKIKLKDEYFIIKEKENALKIKLDQEYNSNLEIINNKLQEERINKNNLEEKSIYIASDFQKYNQEENSIDKKLSNINIYIKNNTINDIGKEENQFDKRKIYYNKYLTQIDYIKEQLKKISQKELLIKDSKQPQCPLCEQSLSNNHKHNLISNTGKERFFLDHRLNRLVDIVKKLKKLLTEQYNKLKILKTKQDKINTIKIQKEQLTENILKIREIIKDLNAKKENNNILLSQNLENLNNLEQQKRDYQKKAIYNIQENSEYKDYISNRIKIENQIKNLEFNQELYNKLIKAREILAEKQNSYKILEKELTLQEQRKINISNVGKKIKLIKSELKIIVNNLGKFNNLYMVDQNLIAQEKETRNNQHYLVKSKEGLLQQKGALEEQKNLLEKKEKELKEYKDKLKVIDQELEDYQDVALALSKEGIQALLIEEALPEIEQEANSILSRLTNNQSHLIIDSLKDLKSGKTKETLDIKISDSIGMRPYELFSGGEAFRIDFALRIAISKLLVRRSGSALQTLIIDEGFGSQDEEGLSHIMESIYKIQEDFAKVIIVSHLPILKEQFPVHFAITKTPQGSIIKVIENG